ncbi:hypothetical protein C7999DRAFT_11246 [Corynascus novoguineensis]|uniref:Zn(2)-C6 fungal-type domain-containing protein n=1 Tax=Corynascus novoguineensis TaxID=1126955 RepID=A0AAN7HTV4_9PEZI|nr:hypothetical protein C7999DRAFT_11246 [Corynascus novoguineensis]
MGFTTVLEPRFRSAIPDTPPEALTPDSASFPLRQFERAPPSPPMSNYEPTVKATDMSSGKGSEEPSTGLRESSTERSGAPREQLPSLSSLFGPPSQIPLLHSPFSDRPGHYSASSSPLDHPPRPTMGSSSYFPSPVSSASQPRSLLEARLAERPQIPPLPRVLPGPLSPVPRQEQRLEYGAGNQWSSVHHEGNREYSLGSRDHPQYYQPSLDRYSSHVPGSRDDSRRTDFRDQLAQQQTQTLNPPATPTSSVGSEAPPAKDGLGPKIWTGTHFLPRFVRAAEVPGEGMCYFYDDGSHCKTVIDGEAVNAHWGVTKAGKPRKRLAIACVTCREKKIKCDPDYPRCVQCEKFGRVCKFKNAPRGGHNTSPSTPPAEPEELRRLGGGMAPRPSTDSSNSTNHNTITNTSQQYHYPRPDSHSSGSVSPRTMTTATTTATTTMHRPASPDLTGPGPRKLARVGYEHYSPTTGRGSPLAPTSEAARPASANYSWRQPETLPRIQDDVLRRAWQSESYVLSNKQKHGFGF